MAKHSTMFNIFNSLVTAAKSTGVEAIYINNVPNASEKRPDTYVVVSLPSRFYREVKGNNDFMVTTGGLYSVCVRAKQNNTPNIVKQTALVDKFMQLFPISDDYITAYDPQILIKGDDETGFQVTSIMFQIRTKINQFLKG